MSYAFISNLYHKGLLQNVKIEGCSRPFNTFPSGIFLMFSEKGLATNKNGLKFHLRIDDEDIEKALKIVATTTQKHRIGFFKVAHKPFSKTSNQQGKQFTIYVDESKMNAAILNSFVNDLETRLVQANIRPNSIGNNMQIGDRLIPNSAYISYRYDKSEQLLSTPKKLLDFFNQHKIPYTLDDEQYPRFVFVDNSILQKLLEKEYLVEKNYDQHDAPIVIFSNSGKSHIQLKYLTNARPADHPYKPPLQKDLLENITINISQQQSDIYKNFVEYPNTGYCEIFTNPKYSNQEVQKITEILKKYNIDYVNIKQENTYVIRMPYSIETENILKENHLISSVYYSEVDKTREAILKILDKSQITQYKSSGRFELAIPTRYSELRHEMINILKQKGINPKKLKDAYTEQYFLSFPLTQKSLNFVQSLKNAKYSSVPTDHLSSATIQHR